MSEPTATGGVGLLDTSTFIHADRVDPDLLPARYALSAVTLAELAVGPHLTDDGAERAVRTAHLRQARASEILPFDDACADAFAVVEAGLRRSGRARGARAFDALIAATAIANGLPLFSGNARDFAGIAALDLRVVPAPS